MGGRKRRVDHQRGRWATSALRALPVVNFHVRGRANTDQYPSSWSRCLLGRAAYAASATTMISWPQAGSWQSRRIWRYRVLSVCEAASLLSFAEPKKHSTSSKANAVKMLGNGPFHSLSKAQ